jgi:hypothetical protein
MFIDPHLDPTRPSYSGFGKLLMAAARGRDCPPKIELHRVCYVGHGPDRIVPSERDWSDKFESLRPALDRAGLRAHVFIWDDLHDRYLITNLIGLLMGNGFDVSGNADELTTWARISRDDRESVQREFDHPNNAFHELRADFSIPA